MYCCVRSFAKYSRACAWNRQVGSIEAQLARTRDVRSESAARGNHVGIIMRNAGHYRGREVPVRKLAIAANVVYVCFRVRTDTQAGKQAT